jgi:DNA-binding NarL/FixJ family response regulator
MKKIRILIIDDSQVFAKSVAAYLETQDTFTIIGTGKDGYEGISMTEKMRPEIVILDVNMPGMNGFETAFQLRKISPGAGIIITSSHSSSNSHDLALDAGADTFIPKEDLSEELIPFIRRISKEHEQFSIAN